MERLHITLIRHLLVSVLLLIVPIYLSFRAGLMDFSGLMLWIQNFSFTILIWLFLILFSAIIAVRMAENKTYDKILKKNGVNEQTLNHSEEQSWYLNLFLKWARCFRCLAYWYGLATGFMAWVFVLPEWYGAFYPALIAAGFSAAIAVSIVIKKYLFSDTEY